MTCVAAPRAWAQVLKADWVDAGQKVIAEQRTCGVRVLVLDATGKPVPGVPVHLALVRAAFPLGVPVASMAAAPEAGATQPNQPRRLWRCLTATSLDRLTDWAQLQASRANAPNFDKITTAIDAATGRGQTIRWGPVFHDDPGRLPDWLVRLRGADLQRQLLGHDDLACAAAAGAVAQFDLSCDSLDHTFIEDHLGLGGLRALFERARLDAPNALLCARFDDALDGERLQLMLRRVTQLREAFINVDMIAVSTHFNGTVVQRQLARELKWLHGLGVPVAIVNLEIGGPSPEAAAINAETVLRTLYAEPVVHGIWFSGLTPDEVGDPNAALLDRQGRLTPVGDIVDKLFHGLWGFDSTLPADSLGDVRCRVPPGVYDVSATLRDGSTAAGRFLVSGAESERLIVVQAAAAK